MNLLELLNGLDEYISVSKHSLSTLKQLCIGLYEAGTVNLQEVCSRFKTGKFTSNTRKVERFFKDKSLDDSEVIRYIIDSLFNADEKLTLAIENRLGIGASTPQFIDYQCFIWQHSTSVSDAVAREAGKQ